MSNTILTTTNLYSKSSIGGFLFYDPSNGPTAGPENRILYQRADGSLWGMVNDGSEFQGLEPGKMKLGSPLVSVVYSTLFDGNSSPNKGSNTFYTNPNNEICVFSYGNFQNYPGWQGPLKDGGGNTFKARSDSTLAAFVYITVANKIPTAHIRVAYQLDGGEVGQLNWDGKKDFVWTKSPNTSPPTLGGTSLSFINQANAGQDQYFRGYYQYLDFTVMELVNEPSNGYVGSFMQPLTQKTRISASYPAQSTAKFPRAQGKVSVHWVNPDGSVSRRSWENGNWSGVQNLDSSIKVAQGAGLLAWSWTPVGALAPLKERLLYVGTDGKLHKYDFP